MKKIIITFALLLGTLITAQTTVDLSNLTNNITLGQNCSSSQTPQLFESVGNAVLNGYSITLRNTHLKVNGDIIGGGIISSCGNSNSQICLSGSISGAPNLNNISIVNCTVLSTNEFDISINYGYNYKLYDLMGKLILQGVTEQSLFQKFPKKQVLFLCVEGFKNKKILIN